MRRYGDLEDFSTTQGAQFTSASFTDSIRASDVRISMDGNGRWEDNMLVERLSMANYFRFYNRERRHQGLYPQRSDQVYSETVKWLDAA